VFPVTVSQCPLIMKVPILGEGEDPAAIVGFEMEQMILPRLSGPHVPKFIAASDFARQSYIVMELIEAPSLLKRSPELPLPYEEVSDIGVKIAAALHVIHLTRHSAKVAAEAACTVTVVRPPRRETSAKHAETEARESSTA
jgi:serine/threonine protein kinase